ncbi:MAG TPA: chemotaxis-specific protein-glutamate methyltransferase CheB [Thermoanaerobaculia bacterium]|nr:chemotaxis-specific protein-glutamate methyltransferase CheB [Thermoanaerobaculia bacterium]
MSRARIAVADDSSFIRRALDRLLAGEPAFEVVGLAASGEELLQNFDAWQPDAVVLDLSMPGMGGLLTLDALRARRPVPVLILSTHSRRGAPETIEALHRGATDFIDKQQVSLVDFEALRQVVVEKLRQMLAASPAAAPGAAAPGVAAPGVAAPGARDARDERDTAGLRSAATGPGSDAKERGAAAAACELIAVGASTGGPPAIERILSDLGGELAVPVAIVQHMPPAFTRSFAKRLDARLPLPVREASHHERLLPGVVYIAPGGRHLVIERRREALRAVLSEAPEPALHRPSVDVLFTSAAAATGGRLVAVLLTGMGLDGAAGMAELAQAGVHTIAQDRATSVIFGMPRAAIEAGSATEVLALENIGPRLRELLAAAPGAGEKPLR